jgi:MATE family multidrug resistance protein
MLRGLHDARVPALIAGVAYWLVGIPLGAWLSGGTKIGPSGIWWGLAAGLAVACCLLGPRLWKFTVRAADA